MLTLRPAKQPMFASYSTKVSVSTFGQLSLGENLPECLVLVVDRGLFPRLVFGQRLHAATNDKLECVVQLVLVLRQRASSANIIEQWREDILTRWISLTTTSPPASFSTLRLGKASILSEPFVPQLTSCCRT